MKALRINRFYAEQLSKILKNKAKLRTRTTTTSFLYKRETNSQYIRTSSWRNFATENKDDQNSTQKEANKSTEPDVEKLKQQLQDAVKVVNKLDWDQLFQAMKKNPDQFADLVKGTGLDNSKPFPGMF